MSGAAGKTFSQIWLSNKETYPLLVAMGFGISVLAARLYHAGTAPEVTFSKSSRKDGARYITDRSVKKEGKDFQQHAFRKYVQDLKPELMPGLNESMTK
mmetsp:Transcript_11076/g.27998  ORF Transcript_11076/g.27998 Transcript_11076/m.27998 type:complete len:99 (+) Transcript_11076:66-362(+)